MQTSQLFGYGTNLSKQLFWDINWLIQYLLPGQSRPRWGAWRSWWRKARGLLWFFPPGQQRDRSQNLDKCPSRKTPTSQLTNWPSVKSLAALEEEFGRSFGSNCPEKGRSKVARHICLKFWSLDFSHIFTLFCLFLFFTSHLLTCLCFARIWNSQKSILSLSSLQSAGNLVYLVYILSHALFTSIEHKHNTM